MQARGGSRHSDSAQAGEMCLRVAGLRCRIFGRRRRPVQARGGSQHTDNAQSGEMCLRAARLYG